jgi:hypothetical protein
MSSLLDQDQPPTDITRHLTEAGTDAEPAYILTTHETHAHLPRPCPVEQPVPFRFWDDYGA